jgi:polygalacturonase
MAWSSAGRTPAYVRRGMTGPAVEAYPPTPLGAPSRSHRLRVLGRPVLVEGYAGISYARFAMRGPVEIEVEVAHQIASHSVFPAERTASTRVAGNVLRFDLPSPQSIVVWIDGLEKLFLLPDPISDDAPIAGSADVIDVTDHGADPTGRGLATTALQSAIDDAAGRSGGGTVLVPPGVYRTGTLGLRSKVTLYLAPGALLQGSADPADYPIDPGRRESAADASLPPDVRFLGRTMTFSRLLLIDRAENVRIAGRGTIDGNGTFLRTRHGAVPNLLRVRQSTRVVVENVLFRNAAAWSLHVLASSDVAVRNVKVINDRANPNTDGIDVDMSTDVSIDRSFIYTKDDAVCIKASGNGDLSGDPARIRVTNSVVSALDAGLKIGSETAATTISDVVFEDDFVFESGRAMSVVVRDGATVERVMFSRIGIGPDVDHLVEQVIGVRDPEVALGTIRDLAFDDVTAPTFVPPATNWTWYAQFRPARPGSDAVVNAFEGADDTHAVDGLRLKGFVVNGRHLPDAATARDVAGLSVGPYVRNVTFE